MILVMDTATSRAIVGLGRAEGDNAVRSWPVQHRHGETLLPTLALLLEEHSATLADLRAIVVGTGPGAFTGLRVGLATAKGLAHGLGLPIVGISTAEALIDADDAGKAADAGTAAARTMLLLPAGPNDRVLVRSGQPPELLPGGAEPELRDADRLVAVDLDGRAPVDAVARGDAARDGLGAAMFRMGAKRLAASDPDDLAALVPEYVTLPRGIRASSGEMTWSRDHR
jgi:tRNA threonylcarbamoyl adenosine modification protein YeaZ